jgi:hypothetical protein
MNQQSISAQVHLEVNIFQDQNDGSSFNGLSLRDAVLMAQSDPGKEYVIRLGEGTYELTIQGNEDLRFQEVSGENLGLFDQIVTRTGDLDVETTVKIIGASAGTTIINASGLGDRLFDVRSGGFLTLENVTVQNGTATGTFEEGTNDPLDPESFLGGGIRVNPGGGARINSSIIKDNRTIWDGITDEANVDGGGISNRGLMEINETTIIGNISDVNAGGIFNSGDLEINNSSIVNNKANVRVFYVDRTEGGGGIQNTEQGTLLIRNSTISGNSTFLSGNDEETFPDGAGGGGILSDGNQTDGSQTTIINSTIVNNTAPLGAGILSASPDPANPPVLIALKNSIVAQNGYTPDAQITFSADIEGFFNSNNSSFNLIGNANGILLDGNKGNIVGDAVNPADPLIGPLAFNGGLTPTHALLNGSPAINAGSNSIANERTLDTEPLLTDQRGGERIIDGTVDIGSYEASPSAGVRSQTSSSQVNTPIYRFQNQNQLGTYLFVGGQERQNIKANFPEFREEGFAFNVGIEPADDLIPMTRFRNTSVPGTYLYAGEEESRSIRRNNPNFAEEGIAFYVYKGDANKGQDIYRFQNTLVPGTYIFVTEQERQNIRQNFTNFVEEGVAFEVAL